MKPIRILHILQRMEAGGTQALLMNIYRNIDRSKLQFDFLVEYKNREFYDDEIEAMGGKIYHLSVRQDFNLPKFARELKSIIRDNPEYRVVHVHTFTIGWLCIPVLESMNVPVRIAHSHNNETVYDIKYPIKRIMQRLYTRKATDLFACSQEAGRYLFGNKSFTVLKNAIDTKKFAANEKTRREAREELGIENRKAIGNVGRFHPQKNQMFLIDIAAELIRRDPSIILLLIGSGDMEAQLRDKVRSSGIESSVIFLGNRSDMPRMFQAMDLFILPSLFEGLGIVAIEAQAAGVPALCSDMLPAITDITPLIKKLSLKLPAADWADKAEEMLTEPLAHSDMSEYIAEAGFDIKEQAEFMQKYYIDKYQQK